MKHLALVVFSIITLQLNVLADNQNSFAYIQPVSIETTVGRFHEAFKDTDQDGIVDIKDKCSNTLPSTQVDLLGCKLIIDDDKDGVSNRNDKCPNSQAHAVVDTYGCESDDDKDGIVNAIDECPNTTKDFIVDKIGCPQTTVLQVEFQSAKYIILPKSYEALKKFADFLHANPSYQAIIYGYTDNLGDNSTNKKLSKERAKAVMNALIQDGVKLTRLTALGMGSNNPIADNNTNEGRAKNRRIEVDLLQ